MKTNLENQSKPIEAIKNVVERRFVNFLRQHPKLRILVADIGVFLFIIGTFSVILWDVPIFVWLYGYQLAAPLLGISLIALRTWQLSMVKPLTHDKVLRYIILVVGIIPIILGCISFMTQNVPGISWTKGVVKPAFASGLTALGIWYLSGKIKLTGFKKNNEIIYQLNQLNELYKKGVLTQEEFNKAKTLLLL